MFVKFEISSFIMFIYNLLFTLKHGSCGFFVFILTINVMRYKLYGLLNHSAPTHMGWNNLQIYQNQFPAGLGPLKQSVTWAVF